MTRDRRGFHYPLEPVRSLTEWDINDVARELSIQNLAATTQQNHVNTLTDNFAAARAEVISQRQVDAMLNIDAQRLAHAYMLQVQHQLLTGNEQLQGMQKECDETLQRLNGLRKFADNLDRNKEALGEEYDQTIVKQSYQQADDNWLQRLHWKKTT